jgi:hypothetical protein
MIRGRPAERLRRMFAWAFFSIGLSITVLFGVDFATGLRPTRSLSESWLYFAIGVASSICGAASLLQRKATDGSGRHSRDE